MNDPIFLALLGGLLAYACYTDLRSFRIPNEVSLAVAALFPVFAISHGMPLADALSHAGCGLAVLAATFALYAAGLRFGGGDAKLLAAVAIWCGFQTLLPLLLTVSMVGGAMALMVLAFHRYGFAGWMVGHGIALPVFELKNGKSYIPFAVAIAAGFALTTL
jgi:prepilin peptidase CpaA